MKAVESVIDLVGGTPLVRDGLWTLEHHQVMCDGLGLDLGGTRMLAGKDIRVGGTGLHLSR